MPCSRSALPVLLWLALACPGIAAPATWTLALDPAEQHTQRVRAVLEVDGQILGEDPLKLPLQVQAEMQYDEQLLDVRDTRRRSWRQYAQAQAVIRINNREHHSVLPADHRELVYLSSPEGRLFHCPAGPLSRQSWDLIDLPGSSTELDLLLPPKPVALHDSWTVPAEAAARVLSVDQVDQGELQATLVEVKDGLARIQLRGDLQAKVAGADVQLKVHAKLNFDLDRRRLRWFAMAIKEQRGSGPLGPALELTARLRLTLDPLDTPLSPPPADQLPDHDRSRIPLEYQSSTAHFALIHDARWFPVTHLSDPQILRRVDEGRVVAQCRISRLTKLAEGRQLGIEEFQQDVRRALGEQLQELVTAEQSTTDSQLRALRVVAVGQVQQVPIQWIYYHLSDQEGHRAAMVFTLNSSDVEIFGGDDIEIAGSFRFVTPASSTEPPSGAETQAQRTRPASPTR